MRSSSGQPGKGRAVRDLTFESMVPAENQETVLRTTLLDLVWRLGEQAECDASVVASVEFLLRSRRVRLTGTFRDAPIEQMFPAES